MAVTVVGSVAFDALETPFGKRDRILGGAATHFALGASFFTDVRVVGVVGDDFGTEEFAVFQSRGINVDDVERVAGEQSFFWAGRYDADMQVAHTLDTQLNVFAGFDPVLSLGARESRVTFLANRTVDSTGCPRLAAKPAKSCLPTNSRAHVRSDLSLSAPVTCQARPSSKGERTAVVAMR